MTVEEAFEEARVKILYLGWEGAFVYCDVNGDICLTSGVMAAKLKAVGAIRGFWLFKEGEVGECWID